MWGIKCDHHVETFERKYHTEERAGRAVRQSTVEGGADGKQGAVRCDKTSSKITKVSLLRICCISYKTGYGEAALLRAQRTPKDKGQGNDWGMRSIWSFGHKKIHPCALLCSLLLLVPIEKRPMLTRNVVFEDFGDKMGEPKIGCRL